MKNCAKHPLVQEPILAFRSWPEFMATWDAATLDVRYGLLFIGFGVPLVDQSSYEERQDNTLYPKREVERIKFYLSMADGYCGDDDFFKDDEEMNFIWHAYEAGRIKTSLGEKKPYELKRMLSRKAFEVLCQKIFKNQNPPEKYFLIPSWAHLIARENIFCEILNFFRAEAPRFCDRKECRNIPRSDRNHNEEIALKFLLEMIDLVWKRNKIFDRESRLGLSDETKDRMCKVFLEKRPVLIDMLLSLNRSDFLIDRAFDNDIDENSIRHLKNLALQTEFYFESKQKKRRVKSIEEAVYAGSEAAKAYMTIQAGFQIQSRLSKIWELQEEEARTKRELERLQKGT